MSFDLNLLKQHPVSASTLYEQAEIYRQQENWEDAIALYQKTIELDPNFSWAYHQLGDIYSHQGKWTEAIGFYHQAIALNPNFSWSYYNLGMALIQQEQWQDSVPIYSKAIELDPDFSWSYYHLGEAYHHEQNWLESVIAYFNAWKKEPEYVVILNRIGEVIQQEIKTGLDPVIQNYCSRLSKADNFSQWQQFLSTDFELYVKSAKYLAENNYEGAAIIFYNIALSIQPHNLEIFQQLQAVLEQKQALDGLVEQCRLAIQQNPNNPELYYDLGIILSRQKQSDEAVDSYLKFLELQPDQFILNLTYQNIVDLVYQNNSLHRAITIYHQAIQNNPESYVLYLNLAGLLTKQNDIPSAIEYNYIAGQKIIPYIRPQWQPIINTLKPVNNLNFLIIGSQKGGTTSLHSYLSEHPQIISSMIKETPFWSNHVHRGLEWYFSHFPPIPPEYNCLVGEATPVNFNSPEAPENLVKFFPNAKLILLLRNPVNRAISHYHHWLRVKWESRSFEDAIQWEIEQLENQTLDFWETLTHPKFQEYGYVSKGLYIYFIEKWMKIFPREQFLILKSEDFYSNPDQGTTQVLKFLGLPEYHLSKYDKYNTKPYPPVSESTRAFLKAYFKPYNQQLEEFLGIHFNWNN